MLDEIHIKDLALIEEAHIKLGPGLNVLTGETGAGKTIVVEAVGLLLGERADVSLVRTGRPKAEVQGLFVVPVELTRKLDWLSGALEEADELLITRVLSADGKSKCYVNGRLVTVGNLAELGSLLIDLHGQHEHQSLFKTALHLDYLDRYAADSVLPLRSKYTDLYRSLNDSIRDLKELESKAQDASARRDLLEFQIGEIDKAKVDPQEELSLPSEREILRHAEKLMEASRLAWESLFQKEDGASARDEIAGALESLRLAKEIDGRLGSIARRLEGLLCELDDCSQELKDYLDTLDFPPGRLEEVEDRLAFLSLLRKKYGDTLEDVLSYRDKAQRELDSLADLADKRQELTEAVRRKRQEIGLAAASLSERRQTAGTVFSKRAVEHLEELNMPGVGFAVSFEYEEDADGVLLGNRSVKLLPLGVDKAEFLISPNKGEPLKPLVRIASGGEISRTMLALKILLADVDQTPTLIFDEIDAGIGGRTATAVGSKLAALARKHQVIAVTHLPQIASFADCHYCILKKEEAGRVATQVEPLEGQKRVEEIARMLSGKSVSDTSIKHAAEILRSASEELAGVGDGAAGRLIPAKD